MSTINDLDNFKALEPFFRIIEQGLDGLADGDHFFDLLAEDVVFDYIITTPGYPRHVEGRHAVADLYRPYGDTIVLDRCHDLAVHQTTPTPASSCSSTGPASARSRTHAATSIR